jgi:hypothetical protein
MIAVEVWIALLKQFQSIFLLTVYLVFVLFVMVASEIRMP